MLHLRRPGRGSWITIAFPCSPSFLLMSIDSVSMALWTKQAEKYAFPTLWNCLWSSAQLFNDNDLVCCLWKWRNMDLQFWERYYYRGLIQKEVVALSFLEASQDTLWYRFSTGLVYLQKKIVVKNIYTISSQTCQSVDMDQFHSQYALLIWPMWLLYLWLLNKSSIPRAIQNSFYINTDCRQASASTSEKNFSRCLKN